MALDLEKYRNILVRERDELTGDIGSVAQVSERIPADSDQDLIEVAQHGPIIDVERKVVDLKSSRLEAINAALQSIEDGTYGTCANCGRQIDPRRLDAEPAAITCIACAAAAEANFTPPEL